MLAYLFNEDLYAVETPAKALTATKNPPEPAVSQLNAEPAREEVFHYLGDNRRFVLVLVNYPDEKFLPEAEQAYLFKVLSAVNLQLDDVAILNYARYSDRKFRELKDFFAFNYLLLFGVSPQQLSLPGPILPYHLGLVDGVKVLAADPTEQFRPDNAKKKLLWGELQKTFR